MFDPVQAWHEEHMYFQRLLELLRREVDLFHGGDTPNYALMRDIVMYLREWGDRIHHPREDEAFRRLVRHDPEQTLAIRRLVQEHRLIGTAGDRLLTLLDGITADGIVSRSDVELAAATYLVYFGNHIAREEEDVLPLAKKFLSAHDWAAARDATASSHDPNFEHTTHERFKHLRRRIQSEAA